MSSRTTASVVTFLNPFVVAEYNDELPAGDYDELALAQDQAKATTNEIKNSEAALSPSEDRK